MHNRVVEFGCFAERPNPLTPVNQFLEKMQSDYFLNELKVAEVDY